MLERLLLCHLLCLLITAVVSIVGGAVKSKPAKKPSAKTIENVESGLVAAVSYSSEGDLNLSDNLENDLSDSRINSWDEDYTTEKNDQPRPNEAAEEESAEDYTEDYPETALNKADRLLLRGCDEEKCLTDEIGEGDDGVMKRLKTLSSDTYLTRIQKSLDCENPENSGTEASYKLKEMLERLPFRPLFSLHSKSITNKNYNEVFKELKRMAHTTSRQNSIEKEKRRPDIEKAFKGKHVKLEERAVAFIIYGKDDVRGNVDVEDEPNTMDVFEEEEEKKES